MAVVQDKGITDAVRVAKIVDLTNDYRTSTTIRASLPEGVSYAMSAEAFHQLIQQGTPRIVQERVRAFCTALNRAFGEDGKSPQSKFEFTFFEEGGRPQNFPLKLEWYSPGKYWLVLLPYEQLLQIIAPAHPSPANRPSL